MAVFAKSCESTGFFYLWKIQGGNINRERINCKITLEENLWKKSYWKLVTGKFSIPEKKEKKSVFVILSREEEKENICEIYRIFFVGGKKKNNVFD